MKNDSKKNPSVRKSTETNRKQFITTTRRIKTQPKIHYEQHQKAEEKNKTSKYN